MSRIACAVGDSAPPAVPVARPVARPRPVRGPVDAAEQAIVRDISR